MNLVLEIPISKCHNMAHFKHRVSHTAIYGHFPALLC